ncbi:MAG TPA: SPOR domain-containing protein [Geminicoccaceae bacterium]|nr:SPOR domain-containing protein [Geminicoccaceae bacterium]
MAKRRSRLLWVGLPVFTVFAVFAVIVWLAYQENARVPEGEPPLVRAMAGPYKLAPDDPGGRQVTEQGAINDLLRDEPGPARPERVLPLPEEPRAPVIGAASSGDAGQTPSTTAEVAPGEALPEQGAGASGEADATREAEAALARLLADVGPSATTAEPPQAVQEPPPPAAPATAAPPPTAPANVAREAAEVATPVDAPSQEADKALTRLLAEIAGLPPDTAPETEPARAPAAAVPAMAPAEPHEEQPAVGPGFRVQLAAVRGQDDAHRAWASLVDKLGPLIAEHRPLYQRAETVNGVFYRVQIGPFASEQAADRLCLEVQRRNASCFVVAP